MFTFTRTLNNKLEIYDKRMEIKWKLLKTQKWNGNQEKIKKKEIRINEKKYIENKNNKNKWKRVQTL